MLCVGFRGSRTPAGVVKLAGAFKLPSPSASATYFGFSLPAITSFPCRSPGRPLCHPHRAEFTELTQLDLFDLLHQFSLVLVPGRHVQELDHSVLKEVRIGALRLLDDRFIPLIEGYDRCVPNELNLRHYLASAPYIGVI